MAGSFKNCKIWDDFISETHPDITITTGIEIKYSLANDGWYDAEVVLFDKENCIKMIADINKVEIGEIELIEMNEIASM
jgi:hypothetical protein